MTWERALEADARLAARNAVLIRAALRQSFDPEAAFRGYQATTPDDSLTLPQQRARARAWATINIRVNLEPLKQIIQKLWAEGYALGDTAAREAITQAKLKQKADVTGEVDWSKWKAGDAVSALLLKPPRAFQQLLQSQGIVFKGFSDTTLTDIGNAIGEAIELGLDAKTSAKNILNHVANPARALSIAITEQNRAISQATVNRYRDAGLQEMEWLVFQPCDKCKENENKKVRLGAPFPSGDTQPPAHPNCRCALAPVIPGFDDPANTAGSFVPPIQVEAFQIPTRTARTVTAVFPERWTQITPKDYVERMRYDLDRRGKDPFMPAAEEMAKRLDGYAIYARNEHNIIVAPSARTMGMNAEKIVKFGEYFDEVYAEIPTWHKKTYKISLDPNDPLGAGTDIVVPWKYDLVIDNNAKGRVLAFTRLGHDTIHFNQDYIVKNIDKAPLGDEVKNWWMPAAKITNPVKYTIAHEIGHTVDSIFNFNRGKFSSSTRRRFGDLLSEYGKEKPEEAYAEAFADWLLNPNPGPLTLAYAEHYGWDATTRPEKTG